nr:NAD(P)H-hydrate dehydratase [Cytophagales bacterium]
MSEEKKNNPDLWSHLLPKKKHHKYDHGHAIIYGAPELTGATNLAAQACARVGTGLVTVFCSEETADTYRKIMPPHIIVRKNHDFNSKSVTAKLYGPGGLATKPDYAAKIPIVLDAEATKNLPQELNPNYVLTPHQGEFDRAFPDVSGSRVEKAQAVARKLNCVIVLKGAETIVSDERGRVVVNEHASPWLATAGTGDVLAGIITGFLAQKMPVYEACCAAVWVHGEAAMRFGEYLTATDLLGIIPDVLVDLNK